MRIITSKHKDKTPGGLADKKEPKDFDQEQIRKGIDVEMEHTDDKELAREIAMDHLVENDKYYDHLEDMEKNMEKDASLEYSMDHFKPGTLVTFVLNGQQIKKRILYTDTKNGRVVVEVGGKNVGIPESRVKIVDEPTENFTDIPLPEANFPRTSEIIFDLTKEAKKEWNPNPFAVCHTTVDKKKNPEKWERCVQQIKRKQKKSFSNKRKKTAQYGGYASTSDVINGYDEAITYLQQEERVPKQYAVELLNEIAEEIQNYYDESPAAAAYGWCIVAAEENNPRHLEKAIKIASQLDQNQVEELVKRFKEYGYEPPIPPQIKQILLSKGVTLEEEGEENYEQEENEF